MDTKLYIKIKARDGYIFRCVNMSSPWIQTHYQSQGQRLIHLEKIYNLRSSPWKPNSTSRSRPETDTFSDL